MLLGPTRSGNDKTSITLELQLIAYQILKAEEIYVMTHEQCNITTCMTHLRLIGEELTLSLISTNIMISMDLLTELIATLSDQRGVFNH